MTRKLDRSALSNERAAEIEFGVTPSGGRAVQAKTGPPEGGTPNTAPASSAEYIVSRIKQNKLSAVIVVLLLAELKELSKRRYVAPYWIAMIHVGLGEKDEAFAWLEKAYQERSWFLVWIKMDPQVDSLRSDSRFTDLMRRIGFPQ